MGRSFPWLMVFGAALLACNGDDTVAPNPSRDAGKDGTVDPGTDGSTTTGPTSLCGKYGGFAGVQGLTKAIFEKVQADCQIGAFFTGLALSQQLHMQDCFAIQLGQIMGCDGKVYDGSKDSNGQVCRSMRDAHQNDPRVSASDLQAFVIDAVGALNAKGLDSGDVNTITKALGTTKDVVQSNNPGLSLSTCPGADAGQDAGDGGQDTGIADAADDGG